MKAELWKEIEDGYFRSKNTPATDAQINYSVRDESHPNRFRYHCESKLLIMFFLHFSFLSEISTYINRSRHVYAHNNAVLCFSQLLESIALL